ncbi:hypothetical protein EYF80_020462 [Liparis tanakae]|uniref:Uncharacterized protein n=1 Tax=Liparis tanakae TaxID=230148 RepID=A0A4Z2HUS1_9TELE|nr:hypothetical protein EYF80_020462 [Liparis tanakae]
MASTRCPCLLSERSPKLVPQDRVVNVIQLLLWCREDSQFSNQSKEKRLADHLSEHRVAAWLNYKSEHWVSALEGRVSVQGHRGTYGSPRSLTSHWLRMNTCNPKLTEDIRLSCSSCGYNSGLRLTGRQRQLHPAVAP